jgi:hypothetical protein
VAELRTTISMSAPNFDPAFDPRISNGMNLHFNNTTGEIYIGLSRSSSPKWAVFSPESYETPSTPNPTPPIEPAFIHVTTSSANPDFAPFTDFRINNALHFHIVYGTPYRLCVGIGRFIDNEEPNWGVFNATSTIS